MIKRINLREEDTLYVLGDVIDRGKDGIPILLDLMSRKNAVFTLGNHEHMSLPALRRLAALPPKPPEPVAGLGVIEFAEPQTLVGFMSLCMKDRRSVVNYIESSPVRLETTVNGRRYHLSHTLPEYIPGFDPKNCSRTAFLWDEPDYDMVYDGNVIFVTGHTPTSMIAPEYTGRIWKGNNHIATDCGAALFGTLGCLCLDTGEEYYVNRKREI